MWDLDKMGSGVLDAARLAETCPEKYKTVCFDKLLHYYLFIVLDPELKISEDLDSYEFFDLDESVEEIGKMVELADRCPETMRVKCFELLLERYLAEIIAVEMREVYDEIFPGEYDEDYYEEEYDDDEYYEDEDEE